MLSLSVHDGQPEAGGFQGRRWLTRLEGAATARGGVKRLSQASAPLGWVKSTVEGDLRRTLLNVRGDRALDALLRWMDMVNEATR